MTVKARIAAAAPAIARDLTGLAGLALIVSGVAMFSTGVAMIVAGIVMTGTAALWARKH